MMDGLQSWLIEVVVHIGKSSRGQCLDNRNWDRSTHILRINVSPGRAGILTEVSDVLSEVFLYVVDISQHPQHECKPPQTQQDEQRNQCRDS